MQLEKNTRPTSGTKPSFGDRKRGSSRLLTTGLLGLLASCMGLQSISTASPIPQKDETLAPPSRNERQVAKVVAKMMREDHLTNSPVDNTISERAFEQYIKNLDPTKVYFLQSDIDELGKWKSLLDDQMLEGDYTAGLEIFKRFLKRIDERTEIAIEMIDANHDYSIDEEIVTDPKRLSFAKDEDEAKDIWRKRIKYSLLVLRGDQEDSKKKEESSKSKPEDSDANKARVKAKPPEDPKEVLRKRYRGFARRMHQLETEDVVEMYISAVTSSFDPHTSYMSKGTFNNFLIQMGLELEGIGATLGATDEGYTVIKNIVPGGAAAKQGGLKVEDKIVAVGQGDDAGERLDNDLAKKNGLDFVDAIGMKLDDVVGMIRGKAGTVVRLQVMSENATEMHVISIVREKVQLEDSAAQGKVFEEGKKPDGSPIKIGVIDLPSFYADMGDGSGSGRSTTTDVKRILTNFKTENVDAVVLDLRKNGGGSLREAIDCTGLFIDNGTVVQVKNSFGRVEKHDDEVRGMAWSGPLVVVTSKFSASASEILAGAVQDYQRGIVVGDSTTHGKGTVQNLANLDQLLYRNADPKKNILGALKITTQQFYRPNGESTQKRGVLSNIVLPSLSDHLDNISESDLDYAIEFDTVPSARRKSYEMVNQQLVDQLAKNSKSRVEQDKEFQEWETKIKLYVEQKNLKSLSLNEKTFMARRAQLNSEKENEDIAEAQMNPKREIERTYYLIEVLKITGDYLLALKG